MCSSRLYRRTAIFCILALGMMVGIFIFSEQTGAVSQNQSDRLTIMLAGLFNKDITSMSFIEQEQFAQAVSYPVRKAAHMSEYAILAILVAEACYSACCAARSKYIQPKLQAFIAAFLICVAYAASDEFHQTLVSARSGQISDVGIDSIGILVGVMLTFALCKHEAAKKSAQD